MFVEDPEDGTPSHDKDGKLLWKEYIVGKKAFDDITTLSEIGEKGVIDKLPSEVIGYEYEFTYYFWLYCVVCLL